MKTKTLEKKLKENLTVHPSVCLTEKEYELEKKRAAEMGMSFSSYARDRLINGKERSTALKKKLCASQITFNNCIDKLYNTILSAETDSLSKDELLPILDIIKKECKLK